MIDLHSHSTASDGALTPARLVHHAAAAGVQCLALTDHDTTAGIDEAHRAAMETGLELIPAVEISAEWRGQSVHIVGVHVDTAASCLMRALGQLRELREERAQGMALQLGRLGFEAPLDGARSFAAGGMITRTHFAQYIVQSGRAPTLRAVFDRYLTPGKPGYVKTVWPGVAEVVSTITGAGGQAILAHPQRYKLSGTGRRELLACFKEAGGEGLEVVAGSSCAKDIDANAQLARRFGLLASAGSDFHSIENSWLKLGRLPPLPTDLTPIWSRW